MNKDFTKEFFQQSWGKDGYYERFSYGVGINTVIRECLEPFYPVFNGDTCLEIGSGGGAFTETLTKEWSKLTAVDVIAMPKKFENYKNFRYIELSNQSTGLPGIYDHSINFCFCYNVFCHLSNELLIDYIKSVHRVLKKKGDFVFMLANYAHTKKHLVDHYDLGELTPVGHYVQDERTLDLIIDKEKWEVVSPNMIPEHRDIIVHLKKK